MITASVYKLSYTGVCVIGRQQFCWPAAIKQHVMSEVPQLQCRSELRLLYVTQNPDTTMPFVSLEMMFANDDLAMIVANKTPEVMTHRERKRC